MFTEDPNNLKELREAAEEAVDGLTEYHRWESTQPPETAYVRRTPWYSTWWFWTATGVVAGGALGGYFLMQDDEESTGRFQVNVGWR